jgi:hypothetical protein
VTSDNGTRQPSGCATVGDCFLRSVYNSLLGDYDVVRDATTEEISQAVFSASPLGALGGYISRPTKAIQSVVDGTRDVETWRVEDLRVSAVSAV